MRGCPFCRQVHTICICRVLLAWFAIHSWPNEEGALSQSAIYLGGRYNLGSFHKSGGGHKQHSPSQFHSLKRFHSLAELLFLLLSWLLMKPPLQPHPPTPPTSPTPLNLAGLQRWYCYCWWAIVDSPNWRPDDNHQGPGLCLSCIKCLVFFGLDSLPQGLWTCWFMVSY